MTTKNPEYDFAWCPGCGDFGVRRAMEFALQQYMDTTGEEVENTVVVAGIGCSGNMVHLLEGPQPFGIHGIHGRTLPMAFGIKGARPDLNVLIAAGDGDFLSIGAEHIAPQVQRNVNLTAVIMDNGVYGLTKGQGSPTTKLDVITPTTPYGKLERDLNPLDLYLTLGATYVASGISTKPRDLASLIHGGMKHPGFALVHVQSPCTQYNDTFDALKGNVRKGIQPIAWSVPDDHDTSDRVAASALVRSEGIPIGLLYQDPDSVALDDKYSQTMARQKTKTAQDLMDSYAFKVQ
jgi:2-oxoglutarate ferredoxin oxidoreductase subunit beta